MDRHQFFPVGVAEILDRIDDLDAGIGNEDVDAAEILHGFLDAGFDGLFVRHIHDDGGRFHAALADLFGGGVRRVLVDVGDGDMRAVVGVHLRDALADAAGRAGHERDLVA